MRIVYAFDNRVPSSQADTEQLINNVAALSRRRLPLTLLLPNLGPRVGPEEIRRFYGVEGSFEIARYRSLRRPRVVQKLWNAVAAAIFGTVSPNELLYTRNLLIALAALTRGRTVVYETYRPWPDQYVFLRPLLRLMFRARRFLGAILHSELALRSFVELGVPEHKLLLAHNGFDPHRLEPALDTRAARAKLQLPLDRATVVYTGRVDDAKGLDSVLEMARRCPNVLFLLVGAKGKDAFTEKASRVHNVRLVPWQPYHAISDWLYAADVLLIPPSSEPLERHGSTVLPMKLFSYLAAGRPILARGTEDVRELLRDGENARLVPPNDIDAAVAALNELLADPVLQELLSSNAQETSKLYTWDARAERIERYLSDRHSSIARESFPSAERAATEGRCRMRGRQSQDSLEVANAQELQEIVYEARRQGRSIRAVGSGGSKSDVTSVPGWAVRLAAPERLVDVTDGVATAPAGITTVGLQNLLREEGLILPTVGEWRNATLAGSLATATHGGSAHHGIMATSVLAFHVVTGTGELKRVARDDPDFTHLAVSLGAFGIVSQVELMCDEHFSLEMETDVVPFEEYLEDPLAQESRKEFHASIWVPAARRVIRFGAGRISAPTQTIPRRTRFGQWTSMARFVARRLGLHGVVSNRFFGGVARGDGADILSPLNVPPHVARFRKKANEYRRRRATELALPASRAAEALALFDPFFRKHESTLNNPIGLRMTASDDFALSPCQGRDTLWMDIFFDASESFEAGLRDLANRLEARCHWGKTLALPAEVLQDRYPQWESFRAARDRFDPDGIFANEFTNELGFTSRTTRR